MIPRKTLRRRADIVHGVICDQQLLSRALRLACQSAITQQDAQFRHAFNAGSWLLTWGLERSTQDLGGNLATTFNGTTGALNSRTTISTSDTFTVRATDAYIGARVAASIVNCNFAAKRTTRNMRTGSSR